MIASLGHGFPFFYKYDYRAERRKLFSSKHRDSIISKKEKNLVLAVKTALKQASFSIAFMFWSHSYLYNAHVILGLWLTGRGVQSKRVRKQNC